MTNPTVQTPDVVVRSNTATDAARTPVEAERDVRQLVEPQGELGAATELVETDLLVEDVSIDGMCGVY